LAGCTNRGDSTVLVRGQALDLGTPTVFQARTPEADGHHFEGNVTLQALRWTAADITETGSEHDIPSGAAWAFWDPMRD
jgi:hypothetical protein